MPAAAAQDELLSTETSEVPLSSWGVVIGEATVHGLDTPGDDPSTPATEDADDDDERTADDEVPCRLRLLGCLASLTSGAAIAR
jgi:hypothetical protein